MKKNLLNLGLLTFALGLNAQNAPLTFVGSDAKVTVLSNTLVYNGGGMKLVEGSTVQNSGNIMLAGTSSDVFEVTDADGATDVNTGFRLIYDPSDLTKYGQLYISGLTDNLITGKVIKEYRAASSAIDAANAGRQQVSLPFSNYTIGDLKSSVAYINHTNTNLTNNGRFNFASAFRWNNAKARYDQISGAESALVGGPSDYYIVPVRQSDGTVVWTTSNVKSFVGEPASDQTLSNVALPLSGAAAGYSFGINGVNRNYFNERYNSYIIDPFVDKNSNGGNWDASNYGKRLYEFANPFLTNIDLTHIASSTGNDDDGIAVSNIYGVATFGSNSLSWQSGVGATYNTSNIKYATVSGGAFQGGDIDGTSTHSLDDVLLIKPMSEFYIKMVDDTAATLDLKKTRRFASTRRGNTAYSPTGKTNSIPADKIVKQLAVIINDAQGREIGRTYYAVSPTLVTGYSPNAELQGYALNYPIFTKEELAGGGVDSNIDASLYINAANEYDFAKKEIALNLLSADIANFTFKVFEGGNRLLDGAQLSTGKSFYIRKGQEIIKINDGDTLAYNSGVDYGVYYDAPEATLSTANSTAGQTVIARKGEVWVVRFAKEWKNANIEVYSAAGQLLHSKQNASTSNDYVLPLDSQVNGLFIVKAISDNGTVVTKKIVK